MPRPRATSALALCLCVVAAALCRGAHAVVFVIPPGVMNTECVLQSLEPSMVRDGLQLHPASFDGRASFFVRHSDTEWTTPPLAQVTIKGPSGAVLWERLVGVDFREDAVFRGEGFGDYQLCARNSRADVPVSVDLSYFSPHEGATGTHGSSTRPPAGGEAPPPGETGAAADDMVTALAAVRRLQGSLHRLRSDQAFLERRQERHASTLASSERRTVVWSAAEAAALMALSGAQMLLFRHAFRNY